MSERPIERIVIDEHELAVALGMSVHFLRKDRCGPRLIPFYRIGGSIRYDMTRVREALILNPAVTPSPEGYLEA